MKQHKKMTVVQKDQRYRQKGEVSVDLMKPISGLLYQEENKTPILSHCCFGFLLHASQLIQTWFLHSITYIFYSENVLFQYYFQIRKAKKV